MAHEVFISHSARDKSVADAACAALEEAGIGCWIAPRDVVPGSSYPAEIIRGIEGCKVVLFLFTAASNESRAVQKELERGVNRGKVILPFRLEEVTACAAVDYLIANEHWLDATRPPLEDRLRELVGAVKEQLRRGTAPSSATTVVPKPAWSRLRESSGGGRKWAVRSVAAAVVLGCVAGGWWAFSRYQAERTPVLEGPEDRAVMVGDDLHPNLLLRFRLPERPNRSARIEIQPAGQPGGPPVVWAASTYLVPDVEGTMRWRVQATWKDKNGQIVDGPWSPWRQVTFFKNRLSKILRTRTCLVGTADISPTDKMVNFDSATLRPGGYEIELLRAFFANQDPPVSDVAISFKPQPEGWGEKFFHMLEGEREVDLLVSGITPTPEREKAWGIRFSAPSFKFHQGILVRKGEAAVRGGEIVPQVVGVAGNTTNADFLLRLMGGPRPRVVIDPGPKYYQSLIGGLQSRRIDAFLVDEVYLPALYRTYPTLAEETDFARLRPEENPKFELSGAAYATRPEDRALREALDEFLKTQPARRKELQEKFFPGLEFIP